MDLKNKSVLVVGMAKSGVPTVKALNHLGARVTINDLKTKDMIEEILDEIEPLCSDIILGEHPANIDNYDLIILSPGIPTDLDFVKNAKAMNIPLIGELELAYRLSKGQFIGITGTNGKTTTTALTGEIFKNAMIDTFVVGNIGLAAISKVFDTKKDTVMVTEVSSFQLETIDKFKPKISAILNMTPDHLNRHKTMDDYIKAKSNIFRNQDSEDLLILNYDNDITRKLADLAKCRIMYFSRKEQLDKGIFVSKGEIIIKTDNHEEKLCKIEDINIPGNHNLENALAAIAIAYNFRIENLTIKNTLRSFKGVEHRLEYVDKINGITFINDSKGTNPDASIKAIEAINPPIILIAGGMDKGGSFDEYVHAFPGKVEKLVLFGETANRIKETALNNNFENIIVVKNLELAVKESFNNAIIGSTVLLSPACASWDMYESFEQRGKHFKECVYKLRG